VSAEQPDRSAGSQQVFDGGQGFPTVLADQATRWLADRVTAG
jgi:hypothetical protein